MAVAGPLYPVNLALGGRRCLVVGGGTVAARKAAGLVECDARVHVVAASVGEGVRALDGVTWEERSYRRGEVAGYRLVIAATDDPATNRAVADDADEHGVWVNSVDDPANCTFTAPALLRRGSLLLTVSTGGRTPALAAWLRDRLADELGPEYETLVDILSEERAAIRATGGPTDDLDWQAALESEMLELIREGRVAEAKERLRACLSSPSD